MRSRAFPRTVGRAGDAPSPATTSGFAAFWVAVRRPSGRQPAGNRGGGTGDLRIGGGWGLLGPGSFDEDCHQPHHLFPLLGAHGDQLGFFKLDRLFQCVIRGTLRPSVPGSRDRPLRDLCPTKRPRGAEHGRPGRERNRGIS